MSRALNPDEAELWARVTATITPLSREPIKSEAPVSAQPAVPVPSIKPKARPAKLDPPPTPAPAPRPGTTLDGTWDRKLRSGSIQPDRIVDLHGLNLDQAWQAIDIALERA